MRINKIKLTNFRNHKDNEIDLEGESAVIVGPNGSGKSNILEAIHLVSTTKSLRSKYDVELIAHKKDLARVEIEALIDEDKVSLELVVTRVNKTSNLSKKQAKINKVKKSLTNFSGTLTSVLFTPEDIDILTGSPSLRRKYIDSVFFQIDKDYKKNYSKYVRVVRQRNKILENISEGLSGRDELTYWDNKLLEIGAEIQRKRKDFFLYTSRTIHEYTSILNDGDANYKVIYKQSPLDPEHIEEYRKAELGSRRTLLGPHRDDFHIELDGFDIASFGSRGQQRTTLLAVKLCEIDYIKETTQVRPILLLDDIFSELDPEHKEAVNSITGLQQTIITTAQDAKEEIEVKKI